MYCSQESILSGFPLSFSLTEQFKSLQLGWFGRSQPCVSLLHEFHWLPVELRIRFKAARYLCFKIMIGSAGTFRTFFMCTHRPAPFDLLLVQDHLMWNNTTGSGMVSLALRPMFGMKYLILSVCIAWLCLTLCIAWLCQTLCIALLCQTLCIALLCQTLVYWRTLSDIVYCLTL